MMMAWSHLEVVKQQRYMTGIGMEQLGQDKYGERREKNQSGDLTSRQTPRKQGSAITWERYPE